MPKCTESGIKKPVPSCPSKRFSQPQKSVHTCKPIYTAEVTDKQQFILHKSASLDTSAHLDHNTKQEELLKNFKKRARTKYVTNIVLSGLLKLRTPLENSYKTTEVCSATLTEETGKMTGMYCNQRWCLVCARIRTARLITGYMPALLKIKHKQFLTLTRKNVPAHLLKATIREMLTVASVICRRARQRYKKKCYPASMRFACLRKIECTYNELTNEYHPHFHFIINSHHAASFVLEEWLSHYGKEIADPAGQDLKVADDNSCMELFKYFTKVISKTKDKADYRIHVAALDVMFRAMKSVRTFQPSGVIKSVSEAVEELQSQETGRCLQAAWSWNGWDWTTVLETYSKSERLDKETGEIIAQTHLNKEIKPLTGYVPSPAIKQISSHLVMPKSAGQFNNIARSGEFDAIPEMHLDFTPES